MGTRSLIGYVDNNENKVHYAYYQYDGYPSWVLPKLKNIYNTYEDVVDLVSRGSASQLKDDINEMDFLGEEFYTCDSKDEFFSNVVDYGADYKYLYYDTFAGWEMLQCFNGPIPLW